MTLASTWHVLDIIGTIAFALSGALVGLSRRMDVFGVIVRALLTAVGGGMIRDGLIDVVPPTALVNTTNLLLAVVTALAAVAVYAGIHIAPEQKRRFAFLFQISDTLGLAAFTVTGVITGLAQKDAHLTMPILLGVLTAVGGGVLRDLLAQRIPVVLRADVYAVASVVGAFFVCFMKHMHGDMQAAAWFGFFIVVLLRICAIHFGWQVYHPRPKRKKCEKG